MFRVALCLATTVVTMFPVLGQADGGASVATPDTTMQQSAEMTRQSTDSKNSAIRVEMEASRAQSTAGEGIGVTAEVVNDAETAITIRESSVTLTVPPEMTGAFNETRTWYAYFPTEHKPEDLGTTYAELTLQPKSSYQVFWTPSDNRRRKGKDGDGALRSAFGGIFDQFTTSLNYLFFTPGDYKITAQVKYWDTPAATAAYRTAQKSTTIHLAAPQSVIMLGAIIGGLIAYTILPQTRRQRLTVTETPTRTVITTLVGRVFQQAYGLFGACLLSVIVTILLARISDTQFLVKVTVNDVWGAITIGFVANYAGSRVLDRLFPPQRTRTTIDETVPVEEATQAHEHREDIAANWQEAESPTQNDETRRDK